MPIFSPGRYSNEEEEEEEENQRSLLRRTTIGNGMSFNMACLFPSILLFFFFQCLANNFLLLPFVGPPESLYDWTRENDLGISNQGSPDQVFSRGHWRLVRCQNGKNFCFALTPFLFYVTRLLF